MLDPIIKSIDVPCDQKMAFTVFLDMGAWWPLDKFTTSMMKGAPANTVRVDTRAGGKIVEIGSDDTETHWGEIETYYPHSYVAMRFNIPSPDYTEDGSTFLEIRFTALAEGGTRVVLTQSDWEAMGDWAEGVHGGYGHGWVMIFEGAYAAACAAAA